MIDLIINKFSTHALFSMFFAVVAAIIMFIVALMFDLPLAGIPAFTFVFGAVVYLVLDFYETFGED